MCPLHATDVDGSQSRSVVKRFNVGKRQQYCRVGSMMMNSRLDLLRGWLFRNNHETTAVFLEFENFVHTKNTILGSIKLIWQEYGHQGYLPRNYYRCRPDCCDHCSCRPLDGDVFHMFQVLLLTPTLYPRAHAHTRQSLGTLPEILLVGDLFFSAEQPLKWCADDIHMYNCKRIVCCRSVDSCPLD